MKDKKTKNLAPIQSVFIILALLTQPSCPRPNPQIRRYADMHFDQINPRVKEQTNRYGSHYPEIGAGHNWITHQAFYQLGKRLLLPTQLDHLENYVQYGVSFADEPWLGRPEAPYGIVPNHLSDRAYSKTTCDAQGNNCYTELCMSRKPQIEKYYPIDRTASAKIDDRVSVSVAATVDILEGCAGRRKANTTPLARLTVEVNGKPFREPEEPALDNLFHFTFQDLTLIDDPSAHEPFNYDVRLMLKTDEIINVFTKAANTGMWEVVDKVAVGLGAVFGVIGWGAAKIAGVAMDDNYQWDEKEARKHVDNVIAVMNKGRIISAGGVGAITYGSILLQISRKFFQGSRAQPDSREFLHVSNIGAARPPAIHADPPFSSLMINLPSTYLGGMPFICAQASDYPRHDFYSYDNSCQYGIPTWPIWVPEKYSEKDIDGFLKQLVRSRPDRSDRSAAIYLGWAAHMLQDTALPYHAANWQGIEHVRQESFNANGYKWSWVDSAYVPASLAATEHVFLCNGQAATVILNDSNKAGRVKECDNPQKVTMEKYIDMGIETRFQGLHRIKDICASENFRDEQVGPGHLNYESVRPFFIAGAKRAYQARLTPPPHGLERLRDAVVSTMILLMCAPPQVPTCAANSIRCSGNQALRCNNDGAEVPVSYCDTNGRPSHCSQGTCIVDAPICVANSIRCSGNQALRCNNDGSEVSVAYCNSSGEPSHCDQGTCISDKCTSLYKCDGDHAYICQGGYWRNSQYCSEYQGTCHQGVCWLCQAGLYRCRGNSAELCDSEGHWVANSYCSSNGSKCINSTCVNPSELCTDGYKCKDGQAWQCVYGRWERSETCSKDGMRCLTNACIVCPKKYTHYCFTTKRCEENGSGPCSPNCHGLGELFCRETNKCYQKTNPTACPADPS